MRVLITGGTGFIGHSRVKHLLDEGHEVIAVGRTHESTHPAIKYATDISERDSIKQLASRYMPDRIEHFASQATVSVSRNDPYSTYKDNILGAVSVLETAKLLNIPIMIFTTDKYYGDLEVASEDDRPIVTIGAYETSKLCQDLIAQSYRKAGVKTTIIRSCNVFGPNDYNRRIVPNTIRDLQKGKQPVIFRNILGVRQYIYITDVNRAIDTILEKASGETFNIGTEIRLSQKEVIELITLCWNQEFDLHIKPIVEDGPEMNEIPSQYLRWEKLHGLGWKPEFDMSTGIEDIIHKLIIMRITHANTSTYTDKGGYTVS